MTTIASTNPPSTPMIHGRMFGLGFSAVTGAIVKSQPPTAVTRSTANRASVFMTVSSTVIRSVSIAPAAGEAYMPSRRAWAAASVAACCAVADCVGPPRRAAF